MEQTRQAAGEKAVLAGLDAACFTREETASETSLEELQALLETAGGECVGTVLQSRPTPDPHSFVGQGKAEEIRDLVKETGAKLVIFDNDLTPSQIKALESITGASVLDRSALILDIFAQRAKTREGKLQVELAQYQYYLPRLTVWNETMGRLGGGIGTRGPGETKLETDRRHIRQRIDKLRRDLKDVRRVRAVQRRQRQKAELPLVAIVGYTNAGKSTLLNALTDAGIEANNRLFDTLDPTTRKLRISETQEVLLSDTVGFIRKLPHHLVSAFKATLEELEYADLLLHVVDVSREDWREQAATVEKVISQLGAQQIPQLLVCNKADLCENPDLIPSGENVVAISAKRKRGLDELLTAMEKALGKGKHRVKLCIPYADGYLLDVIHKEAAVFSTDYDADGTVVDIECDDKLYGQLKEYEVQDG